MMYGVFFRKVHLIGMMLVSISCFTSLVACGTAPLSQADQQHTYTFDSITVTITHLEPQVDEATVPQLDHINGFRYISLEYDITNTSSSDLETWFKVNNMSQAGGMSIYESVRPAMINGEVVNTMSHDRFKSIDTLKAHQSQHRLEYFQFESTNKVAALAIGVKTPEASYFQAHTEQLATLAVQSFPTSTPPPPLLKLNRPYQVGDSRVVITRLDTNVAVTANPHLTYPGAGFQYVRLDCTLTNTSNHSLEVWSFLKNLKPADPTPIVVADLLNGQDVSTHTMASNDLERVYTLASQQIVHREMYFTVEAQNQQIYFVVTPFLTGSDHTQPVPLFLSFNITTG